MVLVITYLSLLGLNGLVIFAANALFPQAVVLGTQTFDLFWAIFHSMGLLALLDTFAIPFIREFEKGRGEMFTSVEWMVAYFFLNLAGVWGISRFSEQFGLGVSSWIVVVALALVLDLLQGVVMMRLEKLRSKLS